MASFLLNCLNIINYFCISALILHPRTKEDWLYSSNLNTTLGSILLYMPTMGKSEIASVATLASWLLSWLLLTEMIQITVFIVK